MGLLDGRRSLFRQADRPHHFAAVDFADGAADEFAFHGNHEDRVFADQADARHRAVVKFDRRAEDRQMGARKTVQGSEQFREGSLVHHGDGSFPGIRIIEAGVLQFLVAFHPYSASFAFASARACRNLM